MLVAGERRIKGVSNAWLARHTVTDIDLDAIIRGECDENQSAKTGRRLRPWRLRRHRNQWSCEAARERSGSTPDIQPVENFSAGRALDKVCRRRGDVAAYSDQARKR
jgi:hypothetical protein